MSIESRKAIPIIGMVSSGKSTFLNSLLGINVLEAKDDITTKFVCIIRHNPKLNEPIFYHINLIKDSKTDDYIYHKDGDISKGNEQIRKKVSQINFDENSKEPNYKNLFYILEIKIKNIVNNEFLKKYDFYHIPGLNETILEKEKSSTSKEGKSISDNDTQKKKSKNIHKDIKYQEMKYINGLFPLLKKKIDFGIIVIDSTNYYYNSNINIITNICSIMQTNIKKYLFILNKIDKVKNPTEVIKHCKAHFTNNINSSSFRIEDNFFQPLNSNQFKNEMLMKSNFECFYLYYFNKYCEQFLNLPDNKITFLDFISYEITSEIKNEDDKKDEIENLAEKVTKEDYSKVKEIYQKTKNESNLKINYGIDFDDEDCENTLKAFYSKFLNKSFIPKYSENVEEILKFFNKFNLEAVKPIEKATEKKNDNTLKKIREQEKMVDNFLKVFHQLKKYINDNNNDNIINSLEEDLKELKMMVSNQRKIFIPLIGLSSVGKSTILNDIVGYKIFPVSGEETTTRGIIIQHSFDGTSKLFEVNIESPLQNNYYIFKEKTNLSPIEGKDKIYNYLESVNDEFSDKEEKCFYILKTPIRFLEDFNISEDLKRRISFIDLPGSNTINNAFNAKKGEFTIYQKILKVCTSFIFVSRIAININDNTEIITEAYSIHKDSKIKNISNFLKNCTFVINLFDKLKEDEKNIKKVQKNISNILNGDKEDNSHIINATFFNAKQYKMFLKELDYYSNASKVISSLKEQYNNQFNSLSCYSTFQKEKNFPKYCLKILKRNLEDLSLKYDSNFKCKNEFKSIILAQIKEIMREFNQPLKSKDNENIEKIANILNFIQINIKNISFYKESDCEDFFSQLIMQIKQSDSYMENEFYEYLDNTMEQFNSFFEIPPEKRNTHAQKEFSILEKKTRKDIEALFKNIDFSEIFEKIKADIINVLNDKMINTKAILKQNNNDMKKSYSLICDEIKKKNMKQLTSDLKIKLDKLNQNFSKIKDELYSNGKEINNKFGINNSFLNDLDKIILIDSIKKHFGISNLIDIKDTDLTDRIISNFGFWGSIGHFFDTLFKKKKNILEDNIKELKTRIEEIIRDRQKAFVRNFDEVSYEIINKITKALLTQSTDLSKISQSDFNNAKELFNITKELLFEDGTNYLIIKNAIIFIRIFMKCYLYFLKFLVGLFFFEEII